MTSVIRDFSSGGKRATFKGTGNCERSVLSAPHEAVLYCANPKLVYKVRAVVRSKMSTGSSYKMIAEFNQDFIVGETSARYECVHVLRTSILFLKLNTVSYTGPV